MWLLALVLAYLIGSVPTAYVVGRYVYGFDIRRRGSGNVGATNALRTMGTFPGLLVLAADTFKGMLAVWLGQAFGGPWLAAFTAMVAIIGHSWSIFLKFEGGRGVATTAGAVLVMAPSAIFWAVVIWFIIVVFTRYVSLGSIIAAALAPFLMLFFHRPWPYTLFTFAGTALIIYRHRPNIKRLLAGTEHKLGERS
ncbi:MAG: acyl phosphate:glycerol-3-phosphate acyltransferase [Moorella sp. (in: firmicutes)]|jgi:glycerol-3-phosphate acyltransferase PlsY|uniref:glycerol-3-phosphate 1-O-acyltransferase PlsY n=1 Tax=unclassified Neomoorella TaxID=2676739 RepID=UPI0010FFAC4F|nr:MULTISPECIES: glycerol-3-phosphate 1-O-acyltransferase PlsY [unclassified Moorella (in: firmicutes)]MDK2816698.1 acyl phosphate:glycerol-3-phosphate acyltransferase [Moorella sp. (in: firmicutes)]MDK2894637.1 acyl phosphate:glycerol-3-phosphate acyltransferase [Moorella sp. (in: firmicutes)]GEA15763.1 glycerol-3-phosphate acyltransferase 2 [Moorella sp. E308F]GEA19406.1 glycerol-3-phosphate acyltransferase 2 [Moorella sp. E306M]